MFKFNFKLKALSAIDSDRHSHGQGFTKPLNKPSLQAFGQLFHYLQKKNRLRRGLIRPNLSPTPAGQIWWGLIRVGLVLGPFTDARIVQLVKTPQEEEHALGKPLLTLKQLT